MPTPTPTLEEHAVFAATTDGHYVRVSARQISYAECVERFNELEIARRDGRTPHVKFYAVRNLADPQWRDAPLSKVHGKALVGRGFADDNNFPGRRTRDFTGAEKAARESAKTYLADSAKPAGGWYFEGTRKRQQWLPGTGYVIAETPRPLTQGVTNLVPIAERRGWIAEHDGRWFVTEPIETKTVVS